MLKKQVTREEWLNLLAQVMAPRFEELGHKFPKIRISCGFTSSGTRGQAIGECWFPKASEDGATEIFIKPDQADVFRVADVLAHELCHAVLGSEAGHGKKFAQLAKDMFLEGNPKATKGGEDFRKYLKPLIRQIGPYPHAKLNAVERAPWKRKQPSQPQKNLRCPDCGYYAKTTEEYLKIGRLRCPVDNLILETKEERDDSDD